MGDADAYDEFKPLDAGGEDDEFEPLEVVPYWVPIEAHDPEIGGTSVVRLFFQPGDRGAAPDVDIAEVLVLETHEQVAIGLVRRGVEGDGPDGVSYGESLSRRSNVSLDVALDEPLGTRPLLDAWTGELVPRIERRSGVPLPGDKVGTPLWRRT